MVGWVLVAAFMAFALAFSLAMVLAFKLTFALALVGGWLVALLYDTILPSGLRFLLRQNLGESFVEPTMV